jgi:hypothetical protein
MKLKEIVETHHGKRQSKYRCPCYDKLWGPKVKLNHHWFHTPHDGARVIEDCKPWPVIAIITKEIS